ncbi:Aste57867_10539 [Aphanomyces stellatus]|uniref:Aste57867_10539 protein n=1 Tax=Aphanomyces stellatus TaxID=120398 RepID=A0A485KR28_9STRA|nr:hypothetical protein As57867_010499 [Aphanomyces stellatus]VFT87412.1 Aste57867_10539 [Aphanomyces stellatus]
MAAKLDELQLAEALPYELRHRRDPQRAKPDAMLQAFPGESVGNFLQRVRPSSEYTSPSLQSSWRWIWIPGPSQSTPTSPEPLNDATKLQCMMEVRAVVDGWSDRLPTLLASDVATEARKVSANMFALAKHYNYGSGKLLLSVDASVVDNVWAAVVHATVDGKLGGGAKVSTKTSINQHVLCIVVACFWDEAKVLAILQHLSSLGLHVTAFKPDIFSSLRSHDLKALHLHSLLYNPAP